MSTKETGRFEVRQGGMTVASTEGPYQDAYRDAVHYFWQYQQDATEDEPVEMVELRCIMKIEQSASKEKQWISVDERLPTWTDGRASKTKVYVMVRTVGCVEKECGFYLAAPDGAWDDADFSPLHRVTHWKPIASSVASKEEPTS